MCRLDRVFEISGRVGKKHHGGLEALDLVQIHEPHHRRGGRPHGDAVVFLVRRDQPLEVFNHVDERKLLVLHGPAQLDHLGQAPRADVAAGRRARPRKEPEIARDSFDGRDRRQGIEPTDVSLEPAHRIADRLGMLRRKAARTGSAAGMRTGRQPA